MRPAPRSSAFEARRHQVGEAVGLDLRLGERKRRLHVATIKVRHKRTAIDLPVRLPVGALAGADLHIEAIGHLVSQIGERRIFGESDPPVLDDIESGRRSSVVIGAEIVLYERRALMSVERPQAPALSTRPGPSECRRP